MPPRSPCPRVEHYFASRLAVTPSAPAVANGGDVLTYAEVARLAQGLASQLASSGVERGSLIGITMERSMLLPAVVLGILQAGAAYLPLDPAYPAERLRFMAREAGLRTVLSDRPERPGWLPGHVRLLTPMLASGDGAATAATPSLSPDALAYIVFTSGSSGRPKGVAMTHRPLSRLVSWHEHNAHLGQAARTLQFAPLSFDVSFQEIFTTWATGGCLITVDDRTRRDPFALLDHLIEQRVERVFLPFVALDGLCRAICRRRPSRLWLRDLVTAGEQLKITPAIRTAFTAHLSARLHNHYGPSETHLVTAHTLEGDPSRWPLLPPIGQAVAGAELHILDDTDRPVADGTPGELFVGGEALSVGYLNRPELTAERFREIDGVGRVYQTGDRVRADGQGVLEFLGRFDGQVKIRGFRVEPAEIEAAVAELDAVVHVAVVIDAGHAGGARLVAYVVPVSGPDDFDVAAARRKLAEWLPDYMLPAELVAVASLPMTPSGKLDRRRLTAVAERGRDIPGADVRLPAVRGHDVVDD